MNIVRLAITGKRIASIHPDLRSATLAWTDDIVFLKKAKIPYDMNPVLLTIKVLSTNGSVEYINMDAMDCHIKGRSFEAVYVDEAGSVDCFDSIEDYKEAKSD